MVDFSCVLIIPRVSRRRGRWEVLRPFGLPLFCNGNSRFDTRFSVSSARGIPPVAYRYRAHGVGSALIDSEAIQRLPAVGANPYELLRTAPGIVGDGARAGNGNAVFLPNGSGPGGSSRGIFQTENQTQISADGPCGVHEQLVVL